MIISPANAATRGTRQSVRSARSSSRWLQRGVVGLLTTIVLLASFGAAYQAIASGRVRREFPPPGQMVDVGGYRLHLLCMGVGSPTVILEHGGGGSVLGWFLLQPQIAKSTRVCAYDRAGLGWSDPGPAPRSGRQIATELHALLHNANIPGPYVLAGWSYGGLFVRNFAAQYPDDVAGMVLLDATHPDVWTRTSQGQAQYQNDSRIYAVARVLARSGLWRLIPNPLTAAPAGLSALEAAQWQAIYNTTNFWDTVAAESRAIPATMSHLRQAGNLGDLPLLVVTAGANRGADGEWAVFQNELATLSTNSVHMVVAQAGHVALWSDPQASRASCAAILQVVDVVRSGRELRSASQAVCE